MSNHEEVKGLQPINKDILEKKKEIKKLMGQNKAAALGLAVLLTVSPALTLSGCRQQERKSEDPNQEQKRGGSSYYHGGGGGSYYYSNGGSYRSGSWGKSYNSTGSGNYFTPRAGGIGG